MDQRTSHDEKSSPPHVSKSPQVVAAEPRVVEVTGLGPEQFVDKLHSGDPSKKIPPANDQSIYIQMQIAYHSIYSLIDLNMFV